MRRDLFEIASMKYDTKWKLSFRKELLRWFDDHQRDLPWRKNKTPYRIWISEIMLQQTQVATVVGYYQRFLKQFPSVRKLAAAEESEVLKLWEGLGYYRRARQMHAASKVIVDQHGGQFPKTFEDVLALPGIGRYTAGAILSISGDQVLPILEGNTIRLFARLTEMRTDPRSSAGQKELWNFSDSMLPNKRCGDFNQALMELGSEICKPKSPLCESCPVSGLCPTFVKGLQAEIPVASKKVKYEVVSEAVVLLCRRGKYLVRLCGEGERWTGLWDFPRFKKPARNAETLLAREVSNLTGLDAALKDLQQPIKHAVTKYRITLDCYLSKGVRGRIKKRKGEQFRWLAPSELEDLPMSVTGRKIANRLTDQE